MLGLIYLLLCVGLGYVIVRACFPNLNNFCRNTYGGRTVELAPAFLCLPAWFLFGTLPMVWATYGLGYLFRILKEPLFVANLVIMPLVLAIILIAVIRLNRKEKTDWKGLFRDVRRGELILFAVILAFFFLLMFWTFFYRNGKLYVGWSVSSDFAPHIGMIRSFAVGNNFPTEYSHFAGEDIKYHFLFQFLVGNLNYLGMRLDWAFNLPSLICLVNAFSLLYFYAVKLSGKRAVGTLTTVLFTFRSSRAFLDYAASIPKGQDFLKTLIDNTDFIGTTEHEDWGLWNLNVYCNQRHLALGIGVLLFLLIYFTQYLFSGTKRCQEASDRMIYDYLAENPEEKPLPGEHMEFTLRESLLSKYGWLPKSILKAVVCGLLLGMCSFFNGACVIACLSILFVMAFVADHRLEFAVTAGITVILSMISTKLFINGSALKPSFFFGFLAQQKTFFGAVLYLVTLCGILPLCVLVAMLFLKKTERYLVFAFSAPVIFAFTVSLTIDISVNHKYIMLGVMLLCIPVASLLTRVFSYRGAYAKLLGVFLLCCLTISGVYDFTIVLKRNDAQSGNVMELNEKSDICQWVMANADSHDIFLTDWYSLNDYVLGGAMLYFGWPYYAWSAGYDTYGREATVYAMYEASSPAELDELVTKYGIRFIVVDSAVRNREEFIVNEQNIINTYGLVFNDGSTRIFDTKQKIFLTGEGK